MSAVLGLIMDARILLIHIVPQTGPDDISIVSPCRTGGTTLIERMIRNLETNCKSESVLIFWSVCIVAGSRPSWQSQFHNYWPSLGS